LHNTKIVLKPFSFLSNLIFQRTVAGEKIKGRKHTGSDNLAYVSTGINLKFSLALKLEVTQQDMSLINTYVNKEMHNMRYTLSCLGTMAIDNYSNLLYQ